MEVTRDFFRLYIHPNETWFPGNSDTELQYELIIQRKNRNKGSQQGGRGR